MEENKPKIGKFSLNYGLILGGISVAFGLMLFSMDAHASQDTSNTVIGIVLAVGVVIWALISFRKANAGLLSLGQAIKLGIGVCLVSGVIYIAYLLLLVNVLDTDFITKIAENTRAAAQEAGVMTEAQIDQQYQGTIDYFWISYPFILIGAIIQGLVIGLIGGLIFKKS